MEESSNEKTVDELRADRVEESSSSRSLREWVRDRSLGIMFVSVFLSTWMGQLFFEWQIYVREEQEQGPTPSFWSGGLWSSFWQSTLENWQSEFQLAAFTIAAAHFVFEGSAESPDSSERIESKLDALLQQLGVDSAEVESRLSPKHRKTR